LFVRKAYSGPPPAIADDYWADMPPAELAAVGAQLTGFSAGLFRHFHNLLCVNPVDHEDLAEADACLFYILKHELPTHVRLYIRALRWALDNVLFVDYTRGLICLVPVDVRVRLERDILRSFAFSGGDDGLLISRAE